MEGCTLFACQLNFILHEDDGEEDSAQREAAAIEKDG
jgi:hypothetical protein